jgi:aspartate/methionine/tyrosine aminotransferase
MRPGPFALERYFAEHEFSARRLLSSSDCEPLAMRELLACADDEARELWEGLCLGYTETRGLPMLRREIAQLHVGVDAEHVLEVVPAEGILLAVQALVEPGDVVVVPMPAYQSLHEVARAAGAVIREWHADPGQGWRFDPATLAELAVGAKLVIVNFPHNPTGWQPSREEFRQIVAIAEHAGAWLLSDEMYRFLENDPQFGPVSAVEYSPRSVSLGGLSKAFGLPGLRVGWLAIPDSALYERIACAKDYTTICGSAPSEILALIALRARSKLLARSRAIVRENIDAFARWVDLNPEFRHWTHPRAGSVALAELPGEESASHFCSRILRDVGIALAPSHLFGVEDRYIRIGFGRADFQAGLAELERYLRRGEATSHGTR